ncbi:MULTISPECIES: gamma-glutamyltransferase family protein [Halorussus]|uniref:gamma-glutamyltransferase family protein n=1 Tax=Halorussus TaxID=1070314 RepID=UPI00209CCCDB|nr:gamma-glutamyltransferase family protein [Halorussus vallis]USZ74391.1 gamma-glutamyltransferase family protein [Halorussus vallis]
MGENDAGSGDAEPTTEGDAGRSDERSAGRDGESKRGTKRRTFLRGTAVALGASAAPAAARERATVDGAPRATQPGQVETARSDDGMVSSVHPAATEIGTNVLREGGNAVDAAAAVQFALNVVQPHSSGIGGGGFMLVYDADEDVTYAVDNRERAPAGAKPGMFLNEQGDPIPFERRHKSGDAVGVPGTLRAIDVALKRFGTMSIDELIGPAVELAAPGGRTATVDQHLAETIAEEVDNFNEAARNVFVPGGQPLQAGDELVQPDLAKTFRLIRERGVSAFYRGEIARAIADTVQRAGGSMTVDDLAAYNVTMDHPDYVEYEDVVVRTMSLPSSGGLTVGQILKITEEFDLGQYGPRSAERYHALIETFHRSYADRGAFMGDKLFVDAPWQGLLDEEYTDQRRSKIPLSQASNPPWKPGDPWSYQPGDPYRIGSLVGGDGVAGRPSPSEFDLSDLDLSRLDGETARRLLALLATLLAMSKRGGSKGGSGNATGSSARAGGGVGRRPTPLAVDRGQTTHFTTADGDGNMVSWTSTIEQFFGTKMMVPGYGFMLNNELTDFDATPGGPNEVQPNKRPLSSTSPTIVFSDGDPLMTLGSPGGKTIITTVAQIIQNVATYDMSLPAAIAAPRIYNDADPEVYWERRVPRGVRERLRRLGHRLQDEPTELGNAQAIMVRDGTYLGAADFRRSGAVDGPGS